MVGNGRSAVTGIAAPQRTAAGAPPNRIDALNIALLMVSAVAAVVLPFELFLFSYAVLGPLHYLTEISWLHDKKYYATGKYDVGLLVAISLILTVSLFVQQASGGPQWIADTIGFDQLERYTAHMIFIGIVAAACFAFLSKPEHKLIGVGVAIALTAVSSRMLVLLGVFLPTLIHVFLFTSIFMLYGALRSRSVTGYLAVALHLLIPVVLLFVLPSGSEITTTQYGADAYNEGFAGLNQAIFNFEVLLSQDYSGLANELGKPVENLTYSDLIFESDQGIAIQRFIAFAYTYHYLNWFSKTEIIRWHAVPRSRFLVVVVVAFASVALYAIDYSLGFKWLFLLSFLHVMLELPLNWVSFTGIFRELSGRLRPVR